MKIKGIARERVRDSIRLFPMSSRVNIRHPILNLILSIVIVSHLSLIRPLLEYCVADSDEVRPVSD